RVKRRGIPGTVVIIIIAPPAVPASTIIRVVIIMAPPAVPASTITIVVIIIAPPAIPTPVIIRTAMALIPPMMMVMMRTGKSSRCGKQQSRERESQEEGFLQRKLHGKLLSSNNCVLGYLIG